MPRQPLINIKLGIIKNTRLYFRVWFYWKHRISDENPVGFDENTGILMKTPGFSWKHRGFHENNRVGVKPDV